MTVITKIRRERNMRKKCFLDGGSKTFFFAVGSIAFCILVAGLNIVSLDPPVLPTVLEAVLEAVAPVAPTQQHIPTVSEPGFCVLTANSGGWGNNVLSFLYSVLTVMKKPNHSNNDTSFTSKPIFPCVCGPFGVILGKLFRNVEQCPPGYACTRDICYRPSLQKENKTYNYVRAFNSQELPKFPSLLELNATFVDEIFALTGVSFTLKDLRTASCAVQIRFGDAFFREKSTINRGASIVRACQDPDRNGSSCFDDLAGQVRKLCPNPRVPIYLATDFPEFTRHFCSKERAKNSKVSFLSSCHEKDLVKEGKHINDVVLPFEAYALDEIEEDARSVVVTLLSDWLALALAQHTHGIGGSTFRESGSYDYFVT
jgi:hypothetical protein